MTPATKSRVQTTPEKTGVQKLLKKDLLPPKKTNPIPQALHTPFFLAFPHGRCRAVVIIYFFMADFMANLAFAFALPFALALALALLLAVALALALFFALAFSLGFGSVDSVAAEGGAATLLPGAPTLLPAGAPIIAASRFAYWTAAGPGTIPGTTIAA